MTGCNRETSWTRNRYVGSILGLPCAIGIGSLSANVSDFEPFEMGSARRP